MKLHRASSQPDWSNVPASRRSSLQRLAAASHGYVTPANATTVIGFVLVVWGALILPSHHYWLGFFLITGGRLADIVDGWLAEATQTKSSIGELLDATVDKLASLVVLIGFAAAQIAPWWIIVLIGLPHLISALIAGVASLRQRRLHPSRLGKVSTAAAWVALSGYLLLRADSVMTMNLLRLTVDLLAAASIVSGALAAKAYLAELQRPILESGAKAEPATHKMQAKPDHENRT